VERAEDLAKGWLVALIEQEPLDRAPSIGGAALPSAGPAICAALTRALGSDLELRRIAAGGELEELVSRTGELAGAGTAEAASRAVDALHAVLWSAALGALGDADASLVAALAERLRAVCELARGAALRRLAGPPRAGLADALAEAVARARGEGAALSLLLVELEDAARMLAIESAAGAGMMLERLAVAVRGAVRPGDPVIAEEGGRLWVLAPGADREGARELGAAVASAVRDGGSWRGAPVRASIGVATLDEDGPDASSLIEAAEEASFAAEAAGIEVARAPKRGSRPEAEGAR
jgi:GGDEF domain-containing protein